jgi:hypothetical protein
VEQPKLAVEAQKLSVGDGIIGMLNVFVDPKATAKNVPAPLAWLWPLIVVCVVYGVSAYLALPYTMQYIDLRLSQNQSQQGTSPEQAERARNIVHAIYGFLPAFTPPIIIVGILVGALLVCGMGSIAGIKTKFRDVFSLMAACQIVSSLQAIAMYVVIHAKGDEITSQEQLTPPFGLDIFLQNIHGTLFALVNFFSIFEIWYLIVLTVGLAYLAKTSKGKAFFAITPAWLVPLILRLLQGMLQPG